jgi:hypothetical protein
MIGAAPFCFARPVSENHSFQFPGIAGRLPGTLSPGYNWIPSLGANPNASIGAFRMGMQRLDTVLK